MLKFWEDHDIFNKSITTRDGKTPYVFFEGPPSANGLPGVHHVLARAIKDIFPRYKTMKGFQVKRKACFIIHQGIIKILEFSDDFVTSCQYLAIKLFFH